MQLAKLESACELWRGVTFLCVSMILGWQKEKK